MISRRPSASDRTCASRWGDYADDCFSVGYLIDEEFSILGDALETRCMESPDILAQCKVA
ncbi:MAG TPA: hypothetical protein VIQ29_26100 [Ancylobacter sp.]